MMCTLHKLNVEHPVDIPLRDFELVVRGNSRDRRFESANTLALAWLDARHFPLGELIEDCERLLRSPRHSLRSRRCIVLTDDLNLRHCNPLLLLLHKRDSPLKTSLIMP